MATRAKFEEALGSGAIEEIFLFGEKLQNRVEERLYFCGFDRGFEEVRENRMHQSVTTSGQLLPPKYVVPVVS
jgi:hypothetical protein